MSPKLQILNGNHRGEVIELASFDDAVIEIGNRKTAHFTVRDPWVSYNHATITRDGDAYTIADQNSSNGTWVDGERVETHTLTPQLVFALGHTKVKFVVGEVSPGDLLPEDEAGGGGGDEGSPWWDKVLTDGADGQADGQVVRRLQRMGAQLEEERRMRQALERFLNLPAGTPFGDAARAGELEAEIKQLKRQLEEGGGGGGNDDGSQVQEIVAQQTERLRRDHMARMVELEDQAAQAQARVVELEGRLQAKTEQAKGEVERVREKLGAEVERLTEELEAARKAASESEAVKAEQAIADGLRDELATRDDKIEALEQTAGDLRVELEAARSEVRQWKQEHSKIVQEIDDISMEQIEVEEEFKERIRELEERLRERGDASAEAAPVGDAPAAKPEPRTDASAVMKALLGKKQDAKPDADAKPDTDAKPDADADTKPDADADAPAAAADVDAKTKT